MNTTVNGLSQLTQQGPPLRQALPMQTLPQWLRARAQLRPDVTALIDGTSGSRYSYGALDHLVGRSAAGLAALGLAPGEVLLMVAPNSPEWPIAALGAMAAGAAASACWPGHGVLELARQWRISGARMVFTTPQLLPKVQAAAALLGPQGRVPVVLLGEAAGTLPFATLLACADAEPEATSAHCTAALPFTAGHCGPAKCVVLSHQALLAQLCQIEQALAAPDTLVVPSLLPMSHIFGLCAVTLAALSRGHTVLTLPELDTARLPELALRLQRSAVPGYAMSEAAGHVALDPADDRPAGACGRLLPGTQARIVGPLGDADLPPGRAGELWWRGPQAFSSYLGDPVATAHTLRPDGWVRSGDLGHFDAEGWLTLSGRLKR